MRSEHGYIYSQMAAERPLGSMSTEVRDSSDDSENSRPIEDVEIADSDLWFGPEAAPMRRKK